MEISELKILIFEIKTSLERLNSRIKMADVLIFYGCYNKLPQTGWFKITEIYSVRDLKVSIKDTIKKSEIEVLTGLYYL